MENIEKIKEEIKKQLLNVKIMTITDSRWKDNYNITDPDDPKNKYNTYFKIVKFKDGYEYKYGDAYRIYITCEHDQWARPELWEMQIEFWADGEFHIFCDFSVEDYWGKIDI